MHESQMHAESCFVTLTYAPEHLPHNNQLDYLHFQQFMRALRYHCKKESIPKPRFFMCGEYGEKFSRPHYHAILFGYRPHDLVAFSGQDENRTYTSKTLDRLWGKGSTLTGELSFNSARYIAGYIIKRIGGKKAETHYCQTNPETGEIYQQVPEFGHMSLKPGIGARWFAKYHKEVFPLDRVVVRGFEEKPPRYYDQLHKQLSEDNYEHIKMIRSQKSLSNLTEQQMRAREITARAGLAQKKRSL